MGEMTQLEYVLKGLKRKSQTTPRTRLPITLDILERMRQVWQHHSEPGDTVMLWAAATMCFFGFLRSGEVTVPGDRGFDPTRHLAFGDVRLSSHQDPQFVVVKIKASKTDPYRQGVSIYLGRTQGELCPVAAVLSYMVQRGTQAGPFFLFRDNKPLMRERFVVAVRKALTIAGYNASLYAGHSFRIGAATTAAQQGIQDSLIKTLGRWESAAYTVYIRTPPEVLQGVAKAMVKKSREQAR